MKLTLESIDAWIKTHKRSILLLLAALLSACLVGLKFIKYNNNIELMLPMDKEVQRSMRFLRESNFSDKLVISLKLKDNQHNTEDLIAATDNLADSIHSPLVNRVIGSITGTDFMQEMIFFLQYSPQLLGPESLDKLEKQLTPAGIKERLSFIYRQSLSPGSGFMMPFLRADPLNLNSPILNNIQKLSQASGYDITVNSGHFLSKDGLAAMIIIKTSVLLTEGFGSRKIVDYLQEKIKSLPAYIIAGHIHTVKNEDSIRSDIRLTSLIASFGFLLLFLFIFRDWRAMIVFLMPLGAVLVSTAVAFLIFRNLSYFVIGLSSVIAGITIDYGIYVYMAVRKAGNSVETLRKIIPPVVFGALTTISVFAVFFFSSVKGYHELAFFSNFTIILCLIFALFILPHFIKEEPSALKNSAIQKQPGKEYSGALDNLLVGLWMAMVIITLVMGMKLRFNNDITQFDSAGKQVAKSEEDFRRTWGSRDLPAVFVVFAKNLEEAYALNDSIYAQAVKAIGKENFTSFASVWPGARTRKSNLEAWLKFWNPEKKKELEGLLDEYGQVYNFSADAFAPFIRQLDDPQAGLESEPGQLAFFEQLKEQFVLKKNGGFQILSFFPDNNEYIAKLSGVAGNFPGTFLVSRKNFSHQVSRALNKEFLFLSFLALFSTVALTFLLLKNLRLTALAMIPVVSALALIAGVMRLAGLSFNIPGVIAAMVVTGIVSDYGMFMVYYCKYKYQTGTILAVTLAAATTLIGAGVLLFAQHPVLFTVGMTMVTGVLAGLLSSLWIIPSAYRLWKTNEPLS